MVPQANLDHEKQVSTSRQIQTIVRSLVQHTLPQMADLCGIATWPIDYYVTGQSHITAVVAAKRGPNKYDYGGNYFFTGAI